jgi:hypothetical protein
MKQFCIPMALLLALCGCASAPKHSANHVDLFKPSIPGVEQTRSELVGRWYGEAPLKQGGTRQWLVERSPDGTYRIDFRMFPTGQSMQASSEAGFWGAAGSVYFTIMRGWYEEGQFLPADPSDSTLYDAYQIISLSQHSFTYRNIQTGSTFTLRRVDDGFSFPDVAE